MTDAELRGWAAGQPFPHLVHMPGENASRCAICGQPWPCPTRREEELMEQETCHDATVRCHAPGSAYGCVLTAGHDGAHRNGEGQPYG